MPKVLSRDGVLLSYELHDYTNPWAKAPILVLQHGYSRSSTFWYSMIPYLARFYRVVCPDLRGLGKSTEGFTLEKGVSAELYLSDLLAIIDATGERTVHYAGESLGGMIGMALAALHPDRIRTLSVFAAPLEINKDLQRKHALDQPTWGDALRKLGSEGWCRAMNGSTRFPPDTDPGLLEWFATEGGKSNVDVLIAMAELAAKVNVEPYLGRIAAPMLGIYPSAGPAMTGGQLDKIKAGVRNLSIITIPSRYHMVYVLQPPVCARHVLYFMATHDGIPCSE